MTKRRQEMKTVKNKRNVLVVLGHDAEGPILVDALRPRSEGTGFTLLVPATSLHGPNAEADWIHAAHRAERRRRRLRGRRRGRPAFARDRRRRRPRRPGSGARRPPGPRRRLVAEP